MSTAEYQAQWYAKNKDRESFKAHRARSNRKWVEQNPLARSAHTKLNNAVRDGRLIRPEACEGCGEVTRVEGHHVDYEQALEVTWLCPPCHAVHRTTN